MMRSHRFRVLPRTLRGISLLEALLALGVGALVITSSVIGVSEYSEGVKVRASADMLNNLSDAADRYARDNYQELLDEAPETYDIDVLDPYYALNIRQDAFRSTFRLTTRAYDLEVPNPDNPGTTMTQEALQVLVIGDPPDDSPLATSPGLRAQIANTAGANAGFISQGPATCARASGSGTRPDGHVCGAFGSFSFAPARFPDPGSDLASAAVVALATQGDSAVYEDRLYRYDFGDPELNTMRTTLYMNDNDIVDPSVIDGVNEIIVKDGPQSITAPNGRLTLRPDTALRLQPQNEVVEFRDRSSDGTPPRIQGTRNQLQINQNNGFASFGERVERTHDGASRSVGTADTYADQSYAQRVRAEAVNSLFNQADDPLRLQKVRNGEVIVGKRVRYRPGGGSGLYEISDGELTAQHVRARDITCADCGGTLSQILPRVRQQWRQKNTYLVSGAGPQAIPKPACSANTRRDIKDRPPKGDERGFRESADDRRYTPRIIIQGKSFEFFGSGGTTSEVEFVATDNGANWLAYPRTQNANATAVAATFCEFTGGNQDPATPNYPANLVENGDFQRIPGD